MNTKSYGSGVHSGTSAEAQCLGVLYMGTFIRTRVLIMPGAYSDTGLFLDRETPFPVII